MRNSLTILPHQLAGQKLTNHAKQALIESGNLARKFGHAEIDNIHLLYAIYLNQGSLGSNILKDFGVKETDLKKLLEQKRDTNAKNVKKNQLLPSNRLKKTFTSAYAIAKKLNYPFVGTEHMIHAIINSDDAAITNFLSNINLKSTPKSLVALFDPAQLSNIPKIFDIPDISLGKPSGKKSSTTPFISKFCIDINKEVHKKNELIIGREIEIQRMINILGRKNKNNPILVGEAGVGKTALVSGLAHRINSGAVPPALYRKKIMGLDVAQLIAGTSFRGEFETRLKEIIKEASAHRNIIIFIDEIHTIVGAGNLSGGLDLANILKPALARGELQIIGATTFEEYKKYIEKDAALERRFQLIQVEEPSKNEAEKILLGIRKDYEKFHNVSISDEAIKLAVELSVRYIQNRFLPDKAIDVIDEAASNIRSKHRVSDFLYQIGKLEDKKLAFLEEKEKLVGQEDYEKAIKLRSQEKEIEQQIKLLQKKQSAVESDYPVNITAADVIETIAKISKIPVEKLSADSGSKIKNIKKVLNSQIVGQKEAIEKLASALLRSQSGVSNPDRPLGSFLFLGPTGVGKTMTAKVLAQEFFDNPKALIRIDMSELMERHNVASLIGSPAGYIGYGEGGKLTEKVRRNPYSVILFDEIEKAHPDVFNILLQILEDGNLTDAEGLRVDFKNTIVILTSNIGTADFTNASKLGFESTDKNSAVSKKFNEIKDHTIKELEKRMRQELLNRLDHILVFNSLGEAEIKKITKKELKKLADRLAKQKISLAFNAAAINFIAKKSLAWNQGARLIRKNIQELLENPISEMIIYNRVKNGKISANVKNNSIKLI